MLIMWTWWRHQMETFSASPALCKGNASVTGAFPSQRPVTRSFDVLLSNRFETCQSSGLSKPLRNIKRLAKWKQKYREKCWFYGTSYFNGLAEKLILHTLFGIIWLAPGKFYHYNFEVLGKYSLLIHHVVGTGIMMTSSNGNIFCVRDHLCGEFAGHRRIPRTKATDAELWCFLWSAPE